MSSIKEAAAADEDIPCINGLEDGDEFDEACKLDTRFCQQLTEEEFENQTVSETEQALSELMEYLDTHTDEFTQLLKKKKRQDMENGGIFSFMKVKMLDMIHGENSPVIQVTQKEREKKLSEMKSNMVKAFDYSMETKGRRCSQRLQDRRTRRTQSDVSTPSRKSTVGSRLAMPPPPPPPPPPPSLLTTPKTALKLQPRKPMTPIENRMNMNTPQTLNKPGKPDANDTFGTPPVLDCSLTSLHQELLSSNPWKRLKSVGENRSPGGTPKRAKKNLLNTPKEPLYQALFNNIQEKFRNVRSPSPVQGGLYDNVISPASVLSPDGFTP